MKKLILAFTVCSLVLFTSHNACADLIYNPDTEHLYGFVPESSWQTAQQAAEDLGGHLVAINDSAEEEWLATTFGTAYEYWIGFNDIASEGDWVWSSGEPRGIIESCGLALIERFTNRLA